MEILILLAAGVTVGTILLFATIGEIFAERSGVMNLGIEGMMLVGAMAAFGVTHYSGSLILGALAGMIAAGLISQVHAFIAINLQADQVVSGLSLNFLAQGLSMVLGESLTKVSDIAKYPIFTIPVLSQIPILGRIFFTEQNIMVYIGYLFIPICWYYINRTRPGMHLRAVGEYPAAADSLGINVYRLRYIYIFVGGMLAGLAGSCISLSYNPGWFSAKTTSGLGWIAVGLVIFAQWDPARAAFGSYVFGALQRLYFDIQGWQTIFGLENPFFKNPYLGYFMKMVPYAFTILVLVIGSREAIRKRIGTPASLGIPYIRGQRGV